MFVTGMLIRWINVRHRPMASGAKPRGASPWVAPMMTNKKAKVMYAVQQPLATAAFGDIMGVPAWKSLPSWYLVATNDEAIPPDAERMFAKRMHATVVEVKSSHVAMTSHPKETAELIERAATELIEKAAVATSK